jgi:hypothetical protein
MKITKFGLNVWIGNGNPEGQLKLPIESSYIDQDTGIFYKKTTGMKTPTGWKVVNGAGTQGLTGEQGPPGFSINIMTYRADVTTANPSDPGAGKMRWNNLNQQLATLLIFDRLTDDGLDVTGLIGQMGIEGQFTIQDYDFALHYKVWVMAGPPQILADFWTVPVRFISSGGAPTFAQNQKLAVILKSR